MYPAKWQVCNAKSEANSLRRYVTQPQGRGAQASVILVRLSSPENGESCARKRRRCQIKYADNILEMCCFLNTFYFYFIFSSSHGNLKETLKCLAIKSCHIFFGFHLFILWVAFFPPYSSFFKLHGFKFTTMECKGSVQDGYSLKAPECRA